MSHTHNNRQNKWTYLKVYGIRRRQKEIRPAAYREFSVKRFNVQGDPKK